MEDLQTLNKEYSDEIIALENLRIKEKDTNITIN